MNAKLAFVAVGLMMVASTAHSAVTNVKFSQVDQAVVPGFVVNDVLLDFTTNIRGQAMILELTSGTIYQDPLGNNTAPSSAFVAAFPSLGFDTFVTMGGRTSQTSSALLEAGGAVNIDQNAVGKFDATGLNISWAPGTGVNVGNMNDFITARITLSADAMGTFRYFGTTEEDDIAGVQTRLFQVVNGVIGGGTVDPDPGIFASTPDPGSVLDFGFGPDTRSLQLAVRNAAAPGSEDIAVAQAVISGANASLFSTPGFAPLTLVAGAADTNIGVQFNGIGTPGVYSALLTLLDDGGATLGTYTLTARVPEPSTIALAGLGLVGLVGFLRRRG